jgi:phospholipid/cholesterol/gamma-HCH transport system ATP-binding protein
MQDSPKIQVRNLTKSFGTKVVLKDISFDVQRGSAMVIMGGSGTGKSVLIKSIMGLHIPDQGSSVIFDGHDITYMPILNRRMLLSKAGVLFQGGALFDSLNVFENITFVLKKHRNYSKSQLKDIALHKLTMVGLESDALTLYPAELSGGMIKRVALARAIACDPEVIFLDEPTAGLDPIMSGIISDLINKSSKELGATTITITHDMNCVRRIADKVALIRDGEFAWFGEGKDMDACENKYVKQFIHGLPKEE